MAAAAWIIQIVIFIVLLLFLPHGSFRLYIILAYILVSIPLVNYIRKKS